MKFILNNNFKQYFLNLSIREKDAHFLHGEKTGKGEIAMRTTTGFTLVELAIVIAIMGILIALSTLSFREWQVKNNIEAEIHDLFTDLSEARTKAFTQKKEHRMIFQPTSYVLRSYSTVNEPKAAGTSILSKNLKYALTKISGSNLAGDITDSYVDFDIKGIASNNFTVIVNPLTEGSALNCLVIHDARVNTGKINGTDCEFR